jgi:hypothetical protein
MIICLGVTYKKMLKFKFYIKRRERNLSAAKERMRKDNKKIAVPAALHRQLIYIS